MGHYNTQITTPVFDNKVDPTIGRLEDRLSELSTLVHTLWEVCKTKGITSEELTEAMKKTIEKEKMKDFDRQIVLRCPKCKRNLQRMSSIGLKCLYCETEVMVDPYLNYEVYSGEISEDEVYGFDNKTGEKVSLAAPAYDVNDDLKFDRI